MMLSMFGFYAVDIEPTSFLPDNQNSVSLSFCQLLISATLSSLSSSFFFLFLSFYLLYRLYLRLFLSFFVIFYIFFISGDSSFHD